MGRRIVIIGGMAGGANAAARARRIDEDAEIVIYERSGNISLANCGLPYYLGGEIDDRSKLLVQTPAKFKRRYNVEVFVNHDVVGVSGKDRTVEVADLSTGRTRTDRFDALVLAPGAAPISLDLPGSDLQNIFTLRLLEETDAIYDLITSGEVKTAVVVGAGFIGLELAEQLNRKGVKVSVVELLDQVLPVLDGEMAWPAAQQLAKHGIDLRVGRSAKSFVGTDKVKAVVLDDGSELAADMVMVGVGVRPQLELAEQLGLKIGSSGGIVVNEHGETSVRGVFAVGDAVEMVHGVTGRHTRIPLAGPANKQGRVAGHFAAGGAAAELMTFKGAVGSSIVRVFDVTAGVTGLTESQARKLGIDDYQVVYSVRPHHAEYYPGAHMLTTKMLFETGTGRVLGAQVVGQAGVDKRIDVFATLIHFGGTIDDLADLDLCYAPPFNGPKDPVNITAFVAQNVRSGLSRLVTPAELDGCCDQVQLVDLRMTKELADKGEFPRAVHVPVDDLRQRVGELDVTRPTIVACQIGLRGFIGERILAANGFEDVRNLTGGFHVWNWHVKARELAAESGGT